MECTRTEDLLSAYLDGDLSEGEKERIAEHLRQCHRCAEEERALRETISLLRNLPAESAPPGLLEGVRMHIGGERTAVPLWKRLFLPAHIKIPLEAAAVVLIFLLAYGIPKGTPSRKMQPSGPAPVESREPVEFAKPKERTDTPVDGRKADALRPRPVDVAEGKSGMEEPAGPSGPDAPPVRKREPFPPPRPEKPSLLADSARPAVPATRVSTGGRPIEPAPPRESPKSEVPASRMFAATPSRMLKAIPYGREVILEVDPENRPGMEERIVALASRLGGTVPGEEPETAGAVAEEAAVRPAIVRVNLPVESSDAFLKELGSLGSIPAVGTVGMLDIPAGPARDVVAYKVRIRVR